MSVSRRRFIKEGAAIGVGATALAGVNAQAQTRWDRTADVVVVGAGASGLPAAIMARDRRVSVIVIDANHDIGGHSILSGGNVPLGGGTSMQKVVNSGALDASLIRHLDSGQGFRAAQIAKRQTLGQSGEHLGSVGRTDLLTRPVFHRQATAC